MSPLGGAGSALPGQLQQQRVPLPGPPVTSPTLGGEVTEALFTDTAQGSADPSLRPSTQPLCRLPPPGPLFLLGLWEGPQAPPTPAHLSTPSSQVLGPRAHLGRPTLTPRQA